MSNHNSTTEETKPEIGTIGEDIMLTVFKKCRKVMKLQRRTLRKKRETAEDCRIRFISKILE